MSMKTFENEVINTLSETTMRDKNAISLEMHLEADLGLDSISMASLVSRFEHHFSDPEALAATLHTLISAETVGELIHALSVASEGQEG